MKERANPALRRLDRLIGIPLVAALAPLRPARRRAPEAMLRQVLATDGSRAPVITFLKSSAIGDTVLLSAVVRDLRAVLPNCRLQLACGTSNAPLAPLLESVDRVVILPMSNPLALWRIRGELRSDVFIDFDSWPRINALLAFVSGSSTTIGFRTPGQHRHRLYDLVVDHSVAVHEVENYRRLVAPVVAAARGSIVGPPRPWLRHSDAAPRSGDADGHRGTIVFHMHAGGSQARFKEWPVARWVALADDFAARGFRVRLSGGPADLTRNEAMARETRPDADVAALPLSSLPDLAAILRDARSVVSVDTGIAHLAAAAGARTVVLHGATSPRRWGALGPHVHHLKDRQAPWIELGFEESPTGSPVLLTVDEVRDTVLELLLGAAASSGTV